MDEGHSWAIFLPVPTLQKKGGEQREWKPTSKNVSSFGINQADLPWSLSAVIALAMMDGMEAGP